MLSPVTVKENAKARAMVPPLATWHAECQGRVVLRSCQKKKKEKNISASCFLNLFLTARSSKAGKAASDESIGALDRTPPLPLPISTHAAAHPRRTHTQQRYMPRSHPDSSARHKAKGMFTALSPTSAPERSSQRFLSLPLFAVFFPLLPFGLKRFPMGNRIWIYGICRSIRPCWRFFQTLLLTGESVFSFSWQKRLIDLCSLHSRLESVALHFCVVTVWLRVE